MQDFIRQENERIAQAYSEAAARNRAASASTTTVTPGSTSAISVGQTTPTLLIAGADGSGNVVHQPSDFNPVQQYGDTTVIRLVP